MFEHLFTEPSEQMNGKQIRELTLRRMEWRRFLPELRIPLHSSDETEDVKLLGNGRPEPFEHPSSSRSGDEDEQESTRPDETSTGKRVPQNPSLWPFKYVYDFTRTIRVDIVKLMVDFSFIIITIQV